VDCLGLVLVIERSPTGAQPAPAPTGINFLMNDDQCSKITLRSGVSLGNALHTHRSAFFPIEIAAIMTLSVVLLDALQVALTLYSGTDCITRSNIGANIHCWLVACIPRGK
jgi:hypothetical protein